jgi:hypothetical protein
MALKKEFVQPRERVEMNALQTSPKLDVPCQSRHRQRPGNVADPLIAIQCIANQPGVPGSLAGAGAPIVVLSCHRSTGTGSVAHPQPGPWSRLQTASSFLATAVDRARCAPTTPSPLNSATFRHRGLCPYHSPNKSSSSMAW